MQPPAPKLRQNEFADDNESSGVNEFEDGEPLEQTTPLSLVIPAFDSVNMLPTPMTYTPPSLIPRSPVGQSLNIPKRRGDVSILQKFDKGSQLRVVSELPPFLDPLNKRISSLPVVSETSSAIDESFNEANWDSAETNGEADILTGYMLENLSKPIRWKKVKEIGSGNFSNVYLYKSIEPVNPKVLQVCVKRIKYPEELMDTSMSEQPVFKDLLSRLESSLTRELAILQGLDHPCIVKLYGINNPVFIENKKPLRSLCLTEKRLPRCDMIMSYCAGGDLLMAATRCNGQLELWLIQRLFAELVMAVQYLHKNNVIHRDLKLENILLKYPLDVIYEMRDSPNFEIKNLLELGDFGLCKKIEPGELCTARCGSEDYVSPEILMGVPYDGRLSDTWALGVILYGLLEDRLPFDPAPNSTTRQRNRATSHRIARYDWKWFRLADENVTAKEIVNNTLARKTLRWSITDIFESKFVREVANSLQFAEK